MNGSTGEGNSSLRKRVPTTRLTTGALAHPLSQDCSSTSSCIVPPINPRILSPSETTISNGDSLSAPTSTSATPPRKHHRRQQQQQQPRTVGPIGFFRRRKRLGPVRGGSSTKATTTIPKNTINSIFGIKHRINNPIAAGVAAVMTLTKQPNPAGTSTASTSSYALHQQQQPQTIQDSAPYQTPQFSERSLSGLESQRFDDNDDVSGVFDLGKVPLLQKQDQQQQENHDDRLNYALLIVLYTLQGIPMGLSASIPFLIQQKLQALAAAPVAAGIASTTTVGGGHVVTALEAGAARAAAKLSYKANAIFALCSWPFSLKLLWAPVVDACFWRRAGRRKSWLVPIQTAAGLLMVAGANFVERQLGLDSSSISTTMNGAAHHQLHHHHATSLNVKGVTAFFFVLYFLMATQDICVDGWALTMLSPSNRGRGPICNSIGQNIGYFLSFVGFLALNDVESSELLWRPLLGLKSDPTQGLVSLRSFIRFMGYFMLVTTILVALFKREEPTPTSATTYKRSDSAMPESSQVLLQTDRGCAAAVAANPKQQQLDEEHELDASELGLKETYRRLWAVCQLPAVQWLFLILFTYRLPTAVSDNVKFLKAVEYGLSKSTTALLSPTVILPLGILVPLVATKIWHGHPLRQFMTAYQFRVTLVPLLDALMLFVLKRQGGSHHDTIGRAVAFWTTVVASTAMQAICSSLQFNAQMTFFASRVDPAIGGSYMTLLNTAANLGGTYPASFIMWLVGSLTRPPTEDDPGRDPYFTLQLAFACLGIVWIAIMGKRVDYVAHLPEDAWRTHLLDSDQVSVSNGNGYDAEIGNGSSCVKNNNSINRTAAFSIGSSFPGSSKQEDKKE